MGDKKKKITKKEAETAIRWLRQKFPEGKDFYFRGKVKKALKILAKGGGGPIDDPPF